MKEKLKIIAFFASPFLFMALLYFLCVLVIGSCMNGVEIRFGFSHGLCNMLESQYDMVIPDGAEMLKGIYDQGREHSWVDIYFTVPEAEEVTFGDDWSKESNGYRYSPNYGSFTDEEFSDILFDYRRQFSDEDPDDPFSSPSFVIYSDVIDGNVYYFFRGYSPERIVIW